MTDAENQQLQARVRELEEELGKVIAQKGGDLLIGFQTELAIQRQEKERLNARLAQAEGLLREAEEATQDKFEIDVADAMCQLLPRITTFLHPEKEKTCNS